MTNGDLRRYRRRGSGTFISSTMIVMMRAMTPSVKASSSSLAHCYGFCLAARQAASGAECRDGEIIDPGDRRESACRYRDRGRDRGT
jgi:hypothetical protein